MQCAFFIGFMPVVEENQLKIVGSDLALFVLFYCWSEVKMFFSRSKKTTL